MRPQSLWLCNGHPAGKGAAHIGRGLSIQLATILQERDSRRLGDGRAQGHYLEGAVAITNDAQQGLRVGRVGITDNGDLSRL